MRLFVFHSVDRMWVCVGTAKRVFECGVGVRSTGRGRWSYEIRHTRRTMTSCCPMRYRRAPEHEGTAAAGKREP